MSSYFHNQPDPSFLARTLPLDSPPHELKQAHQNWVDLESRNRILLSCFILDTQRKTLFDQPATHPYGSDIPSLPLPCITSAWLTRDSNQWREFLISPPSQNPVQTAFQSSLIAASSIHTPHPQIDTPIPSLLTPSFQLACGVSISSLLVTAADSWLFARKATLDSWNASKDYLRAWTATSDAAKATWWAGKILRTYFATKTPNPNIHFTPFLTGLEVEWCLYLSALVIWAYTHPASRISSSRSPGPPNRSRTLPVAQMGSTSHEAMQNLQLPVRSYGPRRASTFSSTTSRSSSLNVPSISRQGSSRHLPSSPAPGSLSEPMHSFLARFDTESWQDMGSMRGVGGAEGVLVGVRSVLLGAGRAEKGVLIQEATGILERLAEGRGRGF